VQEKDESQVWSEM